ncbi:hypothetical protein DDE18_15780 [Nocardioides gansuensis]|uniref:Uncharacterized protein n=1 Tax=Nocardioides gansuensis TaxID=2138300 RepID=A0A2T8F8T1_9ACTN|nr:DUF6221 family protein [Nocardioides gansuensis]PVG82134.1 hypothetical protein DDE18_15780 [Nocardioides gansuensis]
MDALIEFLQARLAEDHAWAKRQERVAIRTHHVGRRSPHPPDHYSRVLADVEAKRRIVARCAETFAGDGWKSDDAPDMARETLRDLAGAYADHPDCRPEWRP